MDKEKKLKVLIVDNHPLFLKFISSLFSADEYEVKIADGGLEAIDIVDSFTPDIFFIYLIMPYINGEKLVKYLRAQKELNESFVVIISGAAKEADSISIPPGADAFIAKGPMTLMARHILDIVDVYRNKRREVLAENMYGLNEIEPRHITQELLFSLKHLEVLLDNMQEGAIEVSMENRIVYMNPSAIEILGVKETELLSKDFLSIFDDENSNIIRKALMESNTEKKLHDLSFKMNDRLFQLKILTIAEGGSQSRIILINDVTIFKKEEERIKKDLEDKKMLIREIHHRVKNNLNIISGLLSIQSSMIKDEQVQELLSDIQPRLHSISLIHEKLYNTEDLRNVKLEEYLPELATLIINMMSPSGLDIILDVGISEIKLDVDKIVSLGLITTELITNAIKYGFTINNPEDNILGIKAVHKDNYEISISNNGNRFPEDVDIDDCKKLGFQIVKLLVEQIDGVLELNTDKETIFRISFP